MNAKDMNTSFGKSAIIGLVTLIVGVAIGVTAERYSDRTSKGETSTPMATTTPPQAAVTPNAPNGPGADWDPFQEMRQMQAEMDRMFQRSISRFHMSPQMSLFPDNPGYSLSLDVRDLKDRYEVHAVLPDAKTSDARVNLDGNLLSVEVTNKATETGHNKGQVTTTEFGEYKQVIQLAGQVKTDQMKVDRKDHELIITIPKVS